MCVFLFRRVGFSPGFVASVMLALSMKAFIFIEYIKSKKAVVGLTYSHSYKFQSSYADVEFEALFWYFVFFTLVFTATILGSKKAKFKPSKNYSSVLTGLPIITIIFVLTCYHALITKMKWIYSYDKYLILRDPNYYGVSDIFGSIIIQNISLIGLIASVCIAGYIGKKISISKLICSFVFVYSFFFQIINLSRWAPLYLILLSLFLLLRNQGRDKLKARLLCLFSIVIYFLIIMGRDSESFGFSSIFAIDLSGLESLQVLLINLIGNIFGGVIVFAHTLTLWPAKYPILYKLLSFSPLPSFIDNFSSIRDAQVRINVYGPYNSIAEAYWFGANYFVVFNAFVATCVYYVERFWWKVKNLNKGIYKGYFAFFLMTFAFFMINQYPLRNSLRWLVLSLLISLWGYYFSARPKN
jgi:hypothetical protein